MYDDYFGLKETPFSIAPNPRFLFMSERHREALAHLVYGVNSDGGFILLTGEVGTGKTTISRCLLDQIPEDSNVALILNPKLVADELLATICDELQIKYPEGNKSIKIFIDCINEHLLETNAQGRKTVVIIEEAQNLTPDVLEQLRLLTNLETNQRKLMQIIMLGQPELLDILGQPELRQLEQRVTARYHLVPLSQKETADYVEHRLGVAGVRERDPIFTPSALKRIYKYTQGVPRKVNLLCDRALLGAYVHNKKTVDSQTVAKASKEVFRSARVRQHTNESKGHWLQLASVTVVVLAFISVAVAFKEEIQSYIHKDPLNLISKSSIQLLDTQPVEVSKYYSFKTVFEQWQTEFNFDGMDICQYAGDIGLKCLKKNGNLRSLLHLNRPAVLTLVNQKGQAIYVAVTQLDRKSATISVNGNLLNISIADLESRWFGDYTLFWKPPPEFTGALSPGDKVNNIKWLVDLLEKTDGRQIPDKYIRVYDGDLVQRVRAFQLQTGLVSDGIAGAQTIIHLNSAAGVKVPVLVKKNTRSSFSSTPNKNSLYNNSTDKMQPLDKG